MKELVTSHHPTGKWEIRILIVNISKYCDLMDKDKVLDTDVHCRLCTSRCSNNVLW